MTQSPRLEYFIFLNNSSQKPLNISSAVFKGISLQTICRKASVYLQSIAIFRSEQRYESENDLSLYSYGFQPSLLVASDVFKVLHRFVV